MLVVKIEVWPNGVKERARLVGMLTCANRTDLSEISDYACGARETKNPLAGTPERDIEFEIKGHDRRQSVFALLAKAMTVAAERFAS